MSTLSIQLSSSPPSRYWLCLPGFTVDNAKQNCAQAFVTDVSWTETVNYWYLGTTGPTEMSSALMTATGSDFDLLTVNSKFVKTGLYHMYLTGPGSLFSYGDHDPNKFSTTANGMMLYSDYFKRLKHIKYPDSNKPTPCFAQWTVLNLLRRLQSSRARTRVALSLLRTSPGRRAVSPTGCSKTPNGAIQPQQIVSNKGKGRACDDEFDGESSPEHMEPAMRESAVSPDGARAKSPTTTGSRAVSPSKGVSSDVYDPSKPQASVASFMMSQNGTNARSPSPVVDRSKAPLESFYKPSSPTVNGFAHTKVGSTGNPTADLIRDLKDKAAEVEALKKKEAWMKVALLKAARSGYVNAESEEELASRADDDDIDSRKVTEMVINLKQLKAKIQATVSDRAREASERVQEAERMRASAVQEAAFYKAKVAALEASAESEV
ncbi:hypothetical protein GY45DRAFT_1401236, partial [Cubamyces sp. BRFM 1775]